MFNNNSSNILILKGIMNGYFEKMPLRSLQRVRRHLAILKNSGKSFPDKVRKLQSKSELLQKEDIMETGEKRRWCL